MTMDNECPYSVGDERFRGWAGDNVTHVQPLAENIAFVGTQTGGAIWLSKGLAEAIPEYWRGYITAPHADGSGLVTFDLPENHGKLIFV